MKLKLTLAAVFFLAVSLQAADSKTVYKTETDILYRNGDDLSDYAKERCRLDVYYPTNTKNFSTVVWFHGGGLTAGNRSIPKRLMKQGIAVIAVNYRLYPKIKAPAGSVPNLRAVLQSPAWSVRLRP